MNWNLSKIKTTTKYRTFLVYKSAQTAKNKVPTQMYHNVIKTGLRKKPSVIIITSIMQLLSF
jgi:hypothetical protein